MVVAVVAVVYVAGAWFMFQPLGLFDRHHLPTCACGDVTLQAWFLALSRSSIGHGPIPLGTTILNYPGGINLMDNVSMPLLGALAAPVTAWAGPVASYVLLLRVGFVASAMSGFAVLRRELNTAVGAAVGGAFYGFSPYMTHQAASHMFLIFVPLPPLILYVCFRRLGPPAEKDRSRSMRTGILLGVLAAAQFFISSELLVSTFLIVVITAVALGIPTWRRTGAWTRCKRWWRSFWPFGGAFAAVSVLLLAYPAWYALGGPRHVSGPTQPVTAPGIDALSTLLPSDGRVLAGLWPGWRTPAVPLLGDTAFLGLPLLVVVIWIVATNWEHRLTRAATAMGTTAWVLALGPRLVWHDHVTHIPLPFAVVTHLPVLEDVVPSRLTLFVDLAVATLLAIGADRLWVAIKQRHRRSATASATATLAAAVSAAALALPVAGYGAVSIGPAAEEAAGLGQVLPEHAVVLAYPYPVFTDDRAMLWQAESGMRFSLLGGYVVRASSDSRLDKTPPLLPPAGVTSLLLDARPSAGVSGLQPASEALGRRRAARVRPPIRRVRGGGRPGGPRPGRRHRSVPAGLRAARSGRAPRRLDRPEQAGKTACRQRRCLRWSFAAAYGGNLS